jgi:hypothetical protein
MGSLPLLFLALAASEYAPDSEPKLSLSLPLSPDMLPSSANRSNLCCCGVYVVVFCTAGLQLVFSGTFARDGVPKVRRVGTLDCVMIGLKGILSRKPLVPPLSMHCVVRCHSAIAPCPHVVLFLVASPWFSLLHVDFVG